MSNLVSHPFETFTNADGEPLENGYIYIGQRGLNPEVSPISVYWDADLTIPAAQPIRTLAGYPARNGSAANIFTFEDTYSITVRNKNQTIIHTNLNKGSLLSTLRVTDYTALRALSTVGLPNNLPIEVTNEGIGGTFVLRNVPSHAVVDDGAINIVLNTAWYATRVFQAPINIKWFGALGDGSDNYTAIQAAIDYAQNSTADRALYFPPGKYTHSEQFTITAACTLYSDSKPGPQNYPQGVSQGGAHLDFSKSVASNTDVGSFAINIDTGSIGSEGFANVHIHHLGIGMRDPQAGGIYVEGAVNVDIEYNWFINNLDNYDSGTSEGIAIYARDMIVSNIRRNTFKNMAYGVVGHDFFNENKIIGNDFEGFLQKPICIFGETALCLRNTIADNNIIGFGSVGQIAIHLAGSVSSTTIERNTFEVVPKQAILADSDNPLVSAPLVGAPEATNVGHNTFIACGGSLAGSKLIQFSTGCDKGFVYGNKVRSPSGPSVALVNISASAIGPFYLLANDPSTLDLVAGDPTKAVTDDTEWRGNVVGATDPDTTGWGAGEIGRFWYRNATTGADKYTLRLWNGVRTTSIQSCGRKTDTTGDSTPEVRGVGVLLCSAAAYTINDLEEGFAGQEVTIYNQNPATLTIDCTGTNLLSRSGANITLGLADWASFKCLDGSTWVETTGR